MVKTPSQVLKALNTNEQIVDKGVVAFPVAEAADHRGDKVYVNLILSSISRDLD